MIKKILLSLGLIGIGFINYGYCETITQDFNVQNLGSMQPAINKSGNPTSYNIGGFEKGTVKTQYNGEKKALAIASNNTLFWWQEDGQPYMYWNSSTQGNPNYYLLCDKFTTTGNQTVNCDIYPFSGGNVQDIINFMGNVQTGDYFGYKAFNGGFGVCFSSNTINNSMCFMYNGGTLGLRDSKGYGNLLIASLDDSILYDGPGYLYTGGDGGGGLDFVVDLSYDYTNQEVYDAYGEAGYYRSMCFSDFSLDDLTVISGDFSQFEPDLDDGIYYTGSTIIDLYNTYSGSHSFYNFFSHWYNLYKYSLTIDSFNSFVGYSKGLWRIGYKYYMAGLGSSSLNYNNFYNYCNCFARMDLSIYGSEIYSCGSVPSDVENYFNKGNNYGSGVLGNLSGDSAETPDEFFDALTNRFNTLLDSDYGDYSGIIPVYILIALMGLIFIRMISH